MTIVAGETEGGKECCLVWEICTPRMEPMRVRISPADPERVRAKLNRQSEILFKAMNAVFCLELDMAKEEVLAKLGQIEETLETIARGLAQSGR